MEIELGQCQREARAAGVPVILVFEGWDAAGKGTLINRFTQAIDPRGFKVHALAPPTEAERLQPWMWRFWTDLPAAGQWAIFDRSWYGRVLADRVDGAVATSSGDRPTRTSASSNSGLSDSGAVLVKFWLHISKREQKRRFQRLRASRATAWRVGKPERRQHRRYDEWLEAVEEMMDRTSAAGAPWTIVEATQARLARWPCSRRWSRRCGPRWPAASPQPRPDSAGERAE